MGRRAADLTTPVPVLGVPALVGVRGWRTTGGDRSGGALLLQTWGPQCSVGVQTSPGISRPCAQHSVQLTDTLSTPSDSIAQTSSSYITKETEEVLLLTRSDKEKRAILKQKSGESKTKKEVTFKALGGEVSEDVACSQRSSCGTYCYARAIKTNPHFAGNVTNVRPKLTRYTNGSVVDSDAIGGISVHSDEVEPVKSACGRDQTRLQGHYAERCGKTLLLSAARPFGVTQKICSHCGGRQSAATRVATSVEKSSPAEGKPLKSALTSLSTSMMPHIDKNLKPSHHDISDKHINPKLLYFSEELKYGKHPACPVHSRGNLLNLSQTHAAGDATSPQHTTILHAKTITVTQATIETRHEDAGINPLPKTLQDGKIPRPTSLALTPQMAIATKPNNPYSHTYPKQLKSVRHNSNVPQSVFVSVHPTPENTLTAPSYSHTKAAVNTCKTTTTSNSTLTSTESLPTKVVQREMHAAQVNIAMNSPRLTPKRPTLSPAANASQTIHKSEITAQPAHASLPRIPCNAGQIPHAMPSSNSKSPSKASLMNSVVSQSTLTRNSNSHTSTKHKSVAAQIHFIHRKSSKSEPTLHFSAAPLNTAPYAAKPLDSRARLPPSAAPSSASPCSSARLKNKALKNSSINLKNPPPTASTSSSSTLTGNQSSACVSGTTSLQSTSQNSKDLSRNEAPHVNQPEHKRGTDGKAQSGNESGVCGNQENNSTSVSLSELLNVSKTHNKGSDVNIHDPASTISPYTESYTDENKSNGNLINELVVHESSDHENSNLSQVTNLQNHISLIKSSSSRLQGHINTEQQRLAHYQGYTETKHEGHFAACPPVKTASEMDTNTEQFALGVSVRHANIHLKSNADKKTLPSYSAIAQTNCEPTASANPVTEPSVHQSSDTSPQVPISLVHSFTAPAPFTSERELCMHTGPECNSTLPSSTMHSASLPRLRSCGAEAIVRPDSKFSPAPPQLCPEDTSLAHSHPAAAALLLPPSPQCCKSAALQQRLESVEASLAANKDRITTLLNIIHDLETCHTPTSGDKNSLSNIVKVCSKIIGAQLNDLSSLWKRRVVQKAKGILNAANSSRSEYQTEIEAECRRCYKTGQDLKNCSTCQKTACIVYSVEYDFRQQEKRFMEILNRTARRNNSFSVHLSQPLNFSLLRNVIIKNLTKSKVRSKKLCKTLFKWLPRKIQQV